MDDILDKLLAKSADIEKFTFEDLINLTETLQDLVFYENNALSKCNFMKVKEIQGTKKRAYEIYSDVVARLKGKPKFWEGLNLQQKYELQDNSDTLNASLTKNKEMLDLYCETNDLLERVFQNHEARAI